MPLTLACAGAATMSSAYFVVFLARTAVPAAPVPPLTDFGFDPGSITTLDAGIAEWMTATPATPSPTHGVWNATTTYAAGNTVSSSHYSILTSASVILHPLTYRSLSGGNVGHDPDDFGGYWTCITQPPYPTNADFVGVRFGYSLNPLPTKATLAATVWTGKLWNSLLSNVLPLADVIQLMDMYVLMNYSVGGSIVPVLSRPATATSSGNTGQGNLYNPGINAQWQTWITGGLGSAWPLLTMTNFQPPPIDGVEAVGTVGEAYISAIVASGGTPPYIYGLTPGAGSLPDGVTLDPATGVISGTPTSSGIFTFTAQVTDFTGATAQVTCAAAIGCGGGGIANAFY